MAARYRALAARLLEAARARYWSRERGLYVDNLPWLAEEGGLRLSDRTLANSILFDQCPGDATRAAAEALATPGTELGLSYPLQRRLALLGAGQGRQRPAVVDDFRRRWATMRSVVENQTIQEDWGSGAR